MKAFVSSVELLSLLTRQGHSFPEAEYGESATCVWPAADIRITIALGPDSTLGPAYRQRYFVCVSDSTESLVMETHPRFAFSTAFQISSCEAGTFGKFISGPIHWLFARLTRFDRILVWPNGIWWSPQHGDRFLHSGIFDDVPQVRAWLGKPGQKPVQDDEVGVVLSPADPNDCRVLWKIAGLASWGPSEFFIGAESCAEVYLIHHHECLVISIPDRAKRQLLLKELAVSTDVLSECSGYVAPWDGEQCD